MKNEKMTSLHVFFDDISTWGLISHFILKIMPNFEQIKSKHHRKIFINDTGGNARKKEN